jgi:hypothetical protein
MQQQAQPQEAPLTFKCKKCDFTTNIKVELKMHTKKEHQEKLTIDVNGGKAVYFILFNNIEF